MRKLSAISVLSIGVLTVGLLIFVYLIIIRPSLSTGPDVGKRNRTPQAQVVDTNEPQIAVAIPISRIAFVGNPQTDGQIYTIAPDGTYLTRITSTPGTYFDPEWSPDGSRIAFLAERDGQRDLYVINADGSNEVRLTNTPDYEIDAEWSPDGSQLLYDDMAGLYVIGTSGDAAQIAPQGYSLARWSPLGSQVAAIRNQNTGSEVVMIDVASGEITNLSTLDGIAGPPDWSPDGLLLALPISPSNGGSGIYVIHMDGSSPPTGFDSPGQNVQGIKWSPDGQTLAMYVWNDNGLVDIYMTDAEGNDSQNVYTATEPWEISWSPDSTQIVVQSQDESSGSFILHIVNRDGSGEQTLSTEPLLTSLMPNWSPFFPAPLPTPVITDGTSVPLGTPEASVEPTELFTATPSSTPFETPTPVGLPVPTLNPDAGLTINSFNFWPEGYDPIDRDSEFQFVAYIGFTSQTPIQIKMLGFLLYADEQVPMPWACMSSQGELPPEYPERPVWSDGTSNDLPEGDQEWEHGYVYRGSEPGTTHLVVWLMLRNVEHQVVYCEQRVYELTPESASTEQPTDNVCAAVCGDAVCNLACGETHANCPSDC